MHNAKITVLLSEEQAHLPTALVKDTFRRFFFRRSRISRFTITRRGVMRRGKQEGGGGARRELHEKVIKIIYHTRCPRALLSSREGSVVIYNRLLQDESWNHAEIGSRSYKIYNYHLCTSTRSESGRLYPLPEEKAGCRGDLLE